MSDLQRIEIEVQGVVQGVGFRPTVYRIASELGLTGWIYNNAVGVHIEVQGHKLDSFLPRLKTQLPPLAEIEAITQKIIPPQTDEQTFTLKPSQAGNLSAKISPDVTVCDDCLTELFDPASRYYLYPFINCTHCGPRYSITEHLPYDRASTSMANFSMCEPCRLAYDAPMNRRYHAQPVACSTCGPQFSHSFSDMASDILAGKILAVKGVGGYQLICDATNSETVQRLRARKHRPQKPFAMMVLNTKRAAHFVECQDAGMVALTNSARPIVCFPKKQGALPELVAPGLNTLGVMLPDSPMHYLLFHALLGGPSGSDWLHQDCKQALIVTSANPGGCPLIKDEKEAEKRLSDIADKIVHHNRAIVNRVDDSVVRVIDEAPVFIRRARGLAPQAIYLPEEIPNTLALGAHLKNTICVTRGREAFLSQHMGTLNKREAIQFYHETISHLLKILNVKPDCVAHDWHPDFYSTQIAASFEVPTFSVQHHHAHLAACAAEHGVTAPAIGIALDGYGMGEASAAWGGECLKLQSMAFDHLGSLKPLPQPGGDVAARQPWRMAASMLHALGRRDLIVERFGHYPQADAIMGLLQHGTHALPTSSCGRLFDAASALLGVCEQSTYEGEAAMKLEALVTAPQIATNGWIIEHGNLNLQPLFERLIDCDPVSGAELFHGTLAAALVQWSTQHAQATGISHILLGGGCLLNQMLSEQMLTQLKRQAFTAYYPRLAPPNDGGISLGQAWIAGNQLMRSTSCV
jgi:hydrogenase maturation protein HypF